MSESEQMSILDYVAFHAEALPSMGHPVGGLSSYFRITSFAEGRLIKLTPPVWWMLAVRWSREPKRSMVFVNVYAALHTQGVDQADLDLFFDYVHELRTEFGHDEVLIMGDFNMDRFWRPNPAGREERSMLEWLRELENADFRVLPERPVVTYADANTTLDYILLSPSLGQRLSSWRVEDNINCQHLPLTASFTLDEAAATTTGDSVLVPRQPNLRFSSTAIDSIQNLLSDTLSSVASFPSVDTLYEIIVRSFFVFGVEKRSGVVGQGSSWWRYVPTDLQIKLRDLEQDAQFLASQWASGRSLFTVQEVISMRRELNNLAKVCFSSAESALLQDLRTQFPNQGLCWKVLKKLRNPSPTVAIDVGTLWQHFSTLFHRRDRPLQIMPDVTEGWGATKEGEEEFDEPFTDEEMVRALRDLNGQAGTGPERIPARAIKEVFADNDARCVLLTLMNLCFQEGVVPEPWGLAELFVLYKGKGLPTLADSYRAIALSDDFRRVYERLVQLKLRQVQDERRKRADAVRFQIRHWDAGRHLRVENVHALRDTHSPGSGFRDFY